MTRVLESTKFTSLQLEMLRLFAVNPPEHELLEIKDMIAKYFLSKAMNRIAQIEAKRGTTNEDLDKWLENEH